MPWRQNIALLERLDDEKTRLWYAQQTLQYGWSQPILCLQINGHAHERHGKALTNFKATLPPADSDSLWVFAEESGTISCISGVTPPATQGVRL